MKCVCVILHWVIHSNPKLSLCIFVNFTDLRLGKLVMTDDMILWSVQPFWTEMNGHFSGTRTVYYVPDLFKKLIIKVQYNKVNK